MHNIYTTSRQDIIGSICDSFSIKAEKVNEYVYENAFNYEYDKETALKHFLNHINFKVKCRIPFKSVSMFHITSRVEKPDKIDYQNLHTALLEETDLSNYLKEHNVIIKDEDPLHLDIYHYGEKYELYKAENYSSNSSEAMLRRRLKKIGSKGIIDFGITGYLVNDNIQLASNSDHIVYCPEILQTISHVFGRPEIENDWAQITKAYVVGIMINIEDIVIDGLSEKLPKTEKIVLIFNSLINYLVKSYQGEWHPRNDNQVVIARNNLVVGSNNIIYCSEIKR